MVPLKFCTFWWIIASRAMILKCIEIIMHKLGKSDSELQHSWFSLCAATPLPERVCMQLHARKCYIDSSSLVAS